ncbi:Serine-threonine protein kinase [Entamoeba marina]
MADSCSPASLLHPNIDLKGSTESFSTSGSLVAGGNIIALGDNKTFEGIPLVLEHCFCYFENMVLDGEKRNEQATHLLSGSFISNWSLFRDVYNLIVSYQSSTSNHLFSIQHHQAEVTFLTIIQVISSLPPVLSGKDLFQLTQISPARKLSKTKRFTQQRPSVDIARDIISSLSTFNSALLLRTLSFVAKTTTQTNSYFSGVSTRFQKMIFSLLAPSCSTPDGLFYLIDVVDQTGRIAYNYSLSTYDRDSLYGNENVLYEAKDVLSPFCFEPKTPPSEWRLGNLFVTSYRILFKSGQSRRSSITDCPLKMIKFITDAPPFEEKKSPHILRRTLSQKQQHHVINITTMDFRKITFAFSSRQQTDIFNKHVKEAQELICFVEDEDNLCAEKVFNDLPSQFSKNNCIPITEDDHGCSIIDSHIVLNLTIKRFSNERSVCVSYVNQDFVRSKQIDASDPFSISSPSFQENLTDDELISCFNSNKKLLRLLPLANEISELCYAPMNKQFVSFLQKEQCVTITINGVQSIGNIVSIDPPTSINKTNIQQSQKFQLLTHEAVSNIYSRLTTSQSSDEIMIYCNYIAKRSFYIANILQSKTVLFQSEGLISKELGIFSSIIQIILDPHTHTVIGLLELLYREFYSFNYTTTKFPGHVLIFFHVLHSLLITDTNSFQYTTSLLRFLSFHSMAHRFPYFSDQPTSSLYHEIMKCPNFIHDFQPRTIINGTVSIVPWNAWLFASKNYTAQSKFDQSEITIPIINNNVIFHSNSQISEIEELSQGVTRIELPYNPIYAITSDFLQLSKLQHLDISYPSGIISEVPPLNLLPLRYLDISGIGAVVSTLSFPSSLKTFICQKTLKKFPSSLPHTLVSLDISYNALALVGTGNSNEHYLDFNGICTYLTGLTSLSMRSCGIKTIPSSISELHNLSDANFSSNQITGLPATFTTLTNLVLLSLGNNHIPAISSEFFALTNIVQLDLSNNPIQWKYGNSHVFKRLIPRSSTNEPRVNITFHATTTAFDELKNSIQHMVSLKMKDEELWFDEDKTKPISFIFRHISVEMVVPSAFPVLHTHILVLFISTPNIIDVVKKYVRRFESFSTKPTSLTIFIIVDTPINDYSVLKSKISKLQELNQSISLEDFNKSPHDFFPRIASTAQIPRRRNESININIVRIPLARDLTRASEEKVLTFLRSVYNQRLSEWVSTGVDYKVAVNDILSCSFDTVAQIDEVIEILRKCGVPEENLFTRLEQIHNEGLIYSFDVVLKNTSDQKEKYLLQPLAGLIISGDLYQTIQSVLLYHARKGFGDLSVSLADKRINTIPKIKEIVLHYIYYNDIFVLTPQWVSKNKYTSLLEHYVTTKHKQHFEISKPRPTHLLMRELSLQISHNFSQQFDTYQPFNRECCSIASPTPIEPEFSPVPIESPHSVDSTEQTTSLLYVPFLTGNDTVEKIWVSKHFKGEIDIGRKFTVRSPKYLGGTIVVRLLIGGGRIVSYSQQHILVETREIEQLAYCLIRLEEKRVCFRLRSLVNSQKCMTKLCLLFNEIMHLVRDGNDVSEEFVLCPLCLKEGIEEEYPKKLFVEKPQSYCVPLNTHKCLIPECVPDYVFTEILQYEISGLSTSKIQLSEGSAARILKATYEGKAVVLKALKIEENDNETSICETYYNKLQELLRELHVMKKIKCEQFVQCVGVTIYPLQIVLEYCEFGSLYDYLGNSKYSLPWKTQLSFACDITLAIAQLHHFNIIHRDIKSPNILVKGYPPRCVLTDFGLCYEYTINEKPCVDNPIWLAPEILNGEPFTIMADIYSFGIVLWEIVTRKKPFSDIKFMADLVGRILLGERPHFDDFTNKNYIELCETCWMDEPTSRPKISDVLFVLKELYDSL